MKIHHEILQKVEFKNNENKIQMNSAILMESIENKNYGLSLEILEKYPVIKSKIFDLFSRHFLVPTKYEAKIKLLIQVPLTKN